MMTACLTMLEYCLTIIQALSNCLGIHLCLTLYLLLIQAQMELDENF